MFSTIKVKSFDSELLKVYSQLNVPLTIKVSKKVLVLFEAWKYSVPVKYIVQLATCKKEQKFLKVYYDRREDYVEPLINQMS